MEKLVIKMRFDFCVLVCPCILGAKTSKHMCEMFENICAQGSVRRSLSGLEFYRLRKDLYQKCHEYSFQGQIETGTPCCSAGSPCSVLGISAHLIPYQPVCTWRIAPWCSATKEHEAGNVFGAEANILSVIDVATLPLSIANFLLQGF